MRSVDNINIEIGQLRTDASGILKKAALQHQSLGDRASVQNMAEEDIYIKSQRKNLESILSIRNDDQAREILLATISAYRQADKPLDIITATHISTYFRTGKINPDLMKRDTDVIQKIGEYLTVLRELQNQALAIPSWPRRKDGTLRFSMMPRLALLALIQKNAQQNRSPEATEAQTPQKIGSLKDVLSIVDNNPKIKAVSFDFMDTLVEWKINSSERQNLMYKSAAKILKKHGIDISPDSYRKIRSGDKRDGIWYQMKNEYYAKGREFKAIDALIKIVREVARVKGKALTNSQIAAISQEIETDIYTIERSFAMRTPHIGKLLLDLKKRGKTLIVYSNTPFEQSHVETTLKKLGLRQYIDFVFASSATGYIKSSESTGAYDHIKNTLHLPANAILHVGDNAKQDYAGAKKAGLHAVQYAAPKAFIQLDKLAPGTPELARKRQELIKGGMDTKAESFMENAVSAERLTPEVRKAAMDAYHIAREVFGPVVNKFCDRILKGLKPGKKSSLCVCLGRDGMSMYLAMKILLNKYPQLYPGITADQIVYVNASRKVKDKVLHDAGVEFQIGYEGEEKKRVDVAPNESKNYKKKMDSYLGDMGFFEANDIVLVDSGLQGSTQTMLEKMYPQKRIRGEYVYSYRRFQDPAKSHKKGYLLQLEDQDPDHKNIKQQTGEGGDQVYRSQSVIYFMEDMFNGTFQSNAHLDEERGKIKPRVTRSNLADSAVVDPAHIHPEFKSSEVYSLCKKMILRGIFDASNLYGSQKTEDPTETLGILESEAQSRKRLREFVRDYNLFVKENNKSELPYFNEKLFRLIVRRVGYARHDTDWKQVLREQDLDNPKFHRRHSA